MQSIDDDIINYILRAEQYKGVKRVGIFGSYARGEQNENSDIDILFDYFYNNDEDNGIDDALQYLDKLEDDLKNHLGNSKIDFVSYKGVMESSSKIVRDKILNDVVWIYGNDNMEVIS